MSFQNDNEVNLTRMMKTKIFKCLKNENALKMKQKKKKVKNNRSLFSGQRKKSLISYDSQNFEILPKLSTNLNKFLLKKPSLKFKTNQSEIFKCKNPENARNLKMETLENFNRLASKRERINIFSENEIKKKQKLSEFQREFTKQKYYFNNPINSKEHPFYVLKNQTEYSNVSENEYSTKQNKKINEFFGNNNFNKNNRISSNFLKQNYDKKKINIEQPNNKRIYNPCDSNPQYKNIDLSTYILNDFSNQNKCNNDTCKVKTSQRTIKTFSSKETLVDSEAQLCPSIQTYMNVMIKFCDVMINYLQSNQQKSVDSHTLMQCVRTYISEQEFVGGDMCLSIFDEQLQILHTMGKDFAVDDLMFIKKFFVLSQNISQNYDSMNNYYIDEKTYNIYFKIKSDEHDSQNIFQNSDLNSGKKLISISDFISKNDHEQNKNIKLDDSQSPASSILMKFNTKNINNALSPSSKNLEKLLLNTKTKSKRNTCKQKGFKKRIYKKSSSNGCKCSKSKCLRLHCVCFRDGKFCGDSCNCRGCFNTHENKTLVQNVIKVTKEINSQAFKNRVLKVDMNGVQVEITSGCSCSKNQCLKNYCECKKNGLACSPLCKCENCKNRKIDLDPAVASSLYQKASRKKKKIIFKNTSKDKIEVTEQILAKRFRS
jgi:hypothetical protein